MSAAAAAAAAGGDGAAPGCHGKLGKRAAKAGNSRHAAAGAGARCVGCHMPRIVYGVLDIHRSHRIEVPRSRARGRPRSPRCLHHLPREESAAWASGAFGVCGNAAITAPWPGATHLAGTGGDLTAAYRLHLSTAIRSRARCGGRAGSPAGAAGPAARAARAG